MVAQTSCLNSPVTECNTMETKCSQQSMYVYAHIHSANLLFPPSKRGIVLENVFIKQQSVKSNGQISNAIFLKRLPASHTAHHSCLLQHYFSLWEASFWVARPCTQCLALSPSVLTLAGLIHSSKHIRFQWYWFSPISVNGKCTFPAVWAKRLDVTMPPLFSRLTFNLMTNPSSSPS